LPISIKMRKLFTAEVQIPGDINCEINNGIFKCNKESVTLEKKIKVPDTEIIIEGSSVKLECEKANKKHRAMINTAVAHIKNILEGLENNYIYKLEICHVHFPMTVKVEGNKIKISNFLGEKTPRSAEIVEGVNVKVKGNEVTVSSPDRNKAGQTAANIEKATKVTNKDRRVFQDGIFITEKPGRR